ncbi:hypothetical protein [Paraburkholderia caballeronis]|uniref:hypothetical protein n=1 Tax=Paraburkholderia caballeronis TaxID=416943 RepID=UPI0010664CFD|nr:hypothetical protein [Paraburkholderia caballeronis]
MHQNSPVWNSASDLPDAQPVGPGIGAGQSRGVQANLGRATKTVRRIIRDAMLRKKFSPPTPLPHRSARLRAIDQSPLPKEELLRLALRYHFALRWLDSDDGQLEHFVLLAQHFMIARSLCRLGCQQIPETTLADADAAISAWTNKGIQTGVFRVDRAAFDAIQAFLLAHDEQLRTASRAAVSVALADLAEMRQKAAENNAQPHSPLPAKMPEISAAGRS